MNRSMLLLIFTAILAAMIAVTTYATLERSVLDAGTQLLSDRWFQATLADAYFGFLTFYLWVAYKERGVWRKVLWFVLIMTLGNIAMSIYVLIQLGKWDATRGVESILLRGADASGRA